MSAGGPLDVPGGGELMCTSAPLLGDVGEDGPTERDLHAMARMVYTGVPLADVAYIFGMSPARAHWCVWCYVWARLGIDGQTGVEPLPPGEDVRDWDPSCQPR